MRLLMRSRAAPLSMLDDQEEHSASLERLQLMQSILHVGERDRAASDSKHFASVPETACRLEAAANAARS